MIPLEWIDNGLSRSEIRFWVSCSSFTALPDTVFRSATSCCSAVTSSQQFGCGRRRRCARWEVRRYLLLQLLNSLVAAFDLLL